MNKETRVHIGLNISWLPIDGNLVRKALYELK